MTNFSIYRKTTGTFNIPRKTSGDFDIYRKATGTLKIDMPVIIPPPAFVSAEIGLIDAYTIDILLSRALNESKIPDVADLIPVFSGGAVNVLGNYTDWFLPSKNEFQLIKDNLQAFGLGNFISSYYWTSSETTAFAAWSYYFPTNVWTSGSKSNGRYSRAIRSFTSSTVYALRDTGPAGGLIFSITDNGDGTYTYLECATTDNNLLASWSNIVGVAVGGTSINLGTGQANTTLIINQVGHTTSDAKSCNDKSTANLNAIIITSPHVYIMLDRAITAGETGTIQYIPNADNDKKLQGTNGAKVIAFTESVTNNITANLPVIVPPLLIEDAAPTKIKIPYDMALDETSIPAVGSYVLGSGKTVTLVEVSGLYVYLTASSRYYQGDTETIAYTKPGTNMIKSLDGDEADSFTATAITNQTILLAPLTNLTAVWINDFARLTVDNIPSDVQVEWEESEDNVTYVPVTTTAVDVVTTDDYTWQNQLMYFRARAKRGIYYSDYIAPVSLLTPLVFKTNQSTLTLLRFAILNVLAGKTVTINYGDGSAPVVKSGNNSNVDYNYSVQANPYYVQLLGSDNNAIQMLYCHSQLTNYGDLSKWVLNAGMTRLFLHQSSFTGTILQYKNLPSGLQYLGLYQQVAPGFSGTFKAQTLPSAFIQMSIQSNTFSGDWSGVLINNSVTNGLFNVNGNINITKAFRGRFDNITDFNFATNALNTAELDSLFAAIDASLTTYPPTVSTTYTLNGAGNGIPTGGALNANIVSIKAKYVTAGFVATIVINT